MKLPLLFNPRSGPGGKDPDSLMRGLPPEVRERIEPAPFGPPWDFAPATAQAQAAGGPLFVWGGDGTIHHAGRALAAAGCPVPLAAVPGGSGNGLVRGLRTPLSSAGTPRRSVPNHKETKIVIKNNKLTENIASAKIYTIPGWPPSTDRASFRPGAWRNTIAFDRFHSKQGVKQ